jgi:PPOX class probable F420-dependent enzyme
VASAPRRHAGRPSSRTSRRGHLATIVCVTTETTGPATGTFSDNIRSFLMSVPRYATIATVNPDGSPHQIVIWFLLRGDEIVVNSRHGRRWPSNIRRDPRANLAVYEAEDAITIECTLERTYEGGEAQADIAAMAHRYDTPEVAEGEIARYRAEPRVSFVLRPVRIHIHGDPS